MKIDPKSAFASAFATASGWRNHYHYRHGQYHQGGRLHESKEEADQWRAKYFAQCRELDETTFMTAFFHLVALEVYCQQHPTEADRADPVRAFYDDCTSHYARYEAA